MRGDGERPLKITFHSTGLTDISGEDSAALDALHELSHVEEVMANEQPTMGATVRQREDAEVGWLTVHCTSSDGSVRSSILPSLPWPELAARIVGQSDVTHPDSAAMLSRAIT